MTENESTIQVFTVATRSGNENRKSSIDCSSNTMKHEDLSSSAEYVSCQQTISLDWREEAKLK